MKIRAILNDFEKRVKNVLNEENKNKPIVFEIVWRNETFTVAVIDMEQSYWYFEDDGTIVFRINDTLEDTKLKTGTFSEFKKELDNFLLEYGDIDQLKDGNIDNTEVINTFYFFTKDDKYSGSYWNVDDFAIYDDGDKIIIQINDFN